MDDLADRLRDDRQAGAAALSGRDDGLLEDRESGAFAWLNELIWREFYRHLLVATRRCAAIVPLSPGRTRCAGALTRRSCSGLAAGETGYPIVDAAMRQLNATGWMHNRLSALSASAPYSSHWLRNRASSIRPSRSACSRARQAERAPLRQCARVFLPRRNR
ncbi:hypothetical protein ISX56_30730 [Serratia ureilytica]|nr:hypothetical protein [Serratia ureilytica]